MRPELPNLLGTPFERAAGAIRTAGGSPEQARRFLRGLYQGAPLALRGPESIARLAARLPGLPRRLREELPRFFKLDLPAVLRRQTSLRDPGTVKLLLSGADGSAFETVLFRNRKVAGRWSLCLSTQAGCRMACPFCATGKAGLTRNLSAAEILGQYCVARTEVPPGERITNLVAMGMGEPLDNLDAVLDAVEVFHHPDCVGLAADRIVLSTCGHVPGLRRLASFRVPVGLAVSLHAATDSLRDRLVPLNRRYPLAVLLDTLRGHPLRRGKWICFEYVLLGGINDTAADARALGPLLTGLRAVVQVIPYNEIPGGEFQAPSPMEARRFADQIRASGVPVSLRFSRGADIDAACGQLAGQRPAPGVQRRVHSAPTREESLAPGPGPATFPS